MIIDIRPPVTEGHKRFFDTISDCFGESLTDERAQQLARILPLERALAAFDGDEMVGVTAAFEFDVTVPGGQLPAAGVTMTGVLPTHRRRGILRSMMQRQLQDVRDWGEPVAILWASEGSIYGRYGYGLAVPEITIELERDRAAFKTPLPPRGQTRLLPRQDAARAMADVYERTRRTVPGMFTRTTDWWEANTFMEHDEKKKPPALYAVLELEGRAEAYAAYKVHQQWNLDGFSEGSLEVIEEVATTPEASAQMWRFLLGIDLIKTIKAYLPLDHPLQHLVAESRRLRMGIKDAVWLRVVDLAATLEGRTYAEAGSVVLELVDDLCPWNGGRWRLDTGGDSPTVERSEEEADLRMAPAELGAVYLGGNTFGELRRAGLVEELKPGATWRADGMFRTERKPWCPEGF